MTEREKIIKVIDEWAKKAVTANKFDGASVYNPYNAAELADALIAAGMREELDRANENLKDTLVEVSVYRGSNGSRLFI